MFTIGYLLDRYGWNKCIKVFGWSEWMLAEGQTTLEDTQIVTEEQLYKVEERERI